MKVVKYVLSALVAGTVAFAAHNASAFPLTLKSLSGTITVTPTYSVLTSNKAATVTKTFDLKTILTLASNTISSTPPPKDAYIAYDPYRRSIYLTNSSGYYRNLNNLTNSYYVYFRLEDMAGSFTTNKAGLTENDALVFEMYFRLVGLDGNLVYGSAGDYGTGTLKVTTTSRSATMDIKGSGGDYGEFGGSYDGVCSASFEFEGSAAMPDWGSTPFITWWE